MSDVVIDEGGGKGYADAGFEWWYVVSDLTAASCRRVCRKSDFQQLNGRNMGFIEVILVISRAK